jgi:hypothetical protein
MAKVLIGIDNGSYTFDASAKQVVITLDEGSPSLDALLVITNVTDNVIIYNFANPLLGGTLSGNTFTLTYDTTTMSDTDDLQIWYYTPDALAVADNETASLVMALRSLINVLGSNASLPDTAGRTRIILDAITASLTLATITTVGTVTSMTTLANQTNIGGLAANMQVASTMQIPVNQLRSQILIT